MRQAFQKKFPETTAHIIKSIVKMEPNQAANVIAEIAETKPEQAETKPEQAETKPEQAEKDLEKVKDILKKLKANTIVSLLTEIASNKPDLANELFQTTTLNAVDFKNTVQNSLLGIVVQSLSQVHNSNDKVTVKSFAELLYNMQNKDNTPNYSKTDPAHKKNGAHVLNIRREILKIDVKMCRDIVDQMSSMGKMK